MFEDASRRITRIQGLLAHLSRDRGKRGTLYLIEIELAKLSVQAIYGDGIFGLCLACHAPWFTLDRLSGSCISTASIQYQEASESHPSIIIHGECPVLRFRLAFDSNASKWMAQLASHRDRKPTLP